MAGRSVEESPPRDVASLPPAEPIRDQKRSSWLLQAAVLVAALALAGRLAGFLRDVLIARFFGATAETDAFLVAWTVPETASPLLIESAVIYALVPLFVRASEREGSPRLATERIFGPALAALALITATVAVSAPVIVEVLAPGLVEDPLAVRSVRVAALTILGFGVAGFMIAALRSKEIFGVPATVTVVYNAGIIGCIVLLHGELGVFGAAIGLAVGAAGMVLVQVPSYVRNIGWPRFSRGAVSYALAAFSPLIPIAAFVLLRHSQIYVERFLASLIEPGAISVLNFAERIAQVPLGITFAIAVVSFPVMARSATGGRLEDLRAHFMRDLKLVTLVMAPAVVLLAVYAQPIVELVFERGSFTASDTRVTAELLRVYVWGLLGHALMAVAVLPVYSLGRRMAMPILSAAVGIAVTVVVGVALIPVLEVTALALASALGAIVMAIDLLRRVNESVLPFDARELARHLVKVALAGLVAGLVGWGVHEAMPGSAGVQVLVGGLVVAGTYLLAGRVLGIDHVGALLRPLTRAIFRG